MRWWLMFCTRSTRCFFTCWERSCLDFWMMASVSFSTLSKGVAKRGLVVFGGWSVNLKLALLGIKLRFENLSIALDL